MNENGSLGEIDRHHLEMRLVAVPKLIVWYGKMIESLRADAEQLIRSGYTHILGTFLKNEAETHQRMYEWASAVLTEPCPTQEEDYTGWLTYVMCLRMLRRHAAAWRYRDDWLEVWSPEEPTLDEEGVQEWTAEELALAAGAVMRGET